MNRIKLVLWIPRARGFLEHASARTVLEVELKGDTLVNVVNGVELNRVTGIAVRKGAIALQAEGGAAEFGNVWIEETDAPLLPYAETPHYAPDGCHPEGGAQRVIAEITARKLLCKEGRE